MHFEMTDRKHAAIHAISMAVGQAGFISVTTIQTIVTDPIRKHQHCDDLPCSVGVMDYTDANRS
jgi:hypothetical protein